MQVLRDKIEGFAGEDDAARRLRDLWAKAWNRTTFQVMIRDDMMPRSIDGDVMQCDEMI